jgi:hypothetical protein
MEVQKLKQTVVNVISKILDTSLEIPFVKKPLKVKLKPPHESAPRVPNSVKHAASKPPAESGLSYAALQRKQQDLKKNFQNFLQTLEEQKKSERDGKVQVKGVENVQWRPEEQLISTSHCFRSSFVEQPSISSRRDSSNNQPSHRSSFLRSSFGSMQL